MAPRRRQAAPSAGAAPASLASLPDALLERILGLLGQRDRHHAALVSRRWYAAAHVPDVLRSISSYGSTPARLPSLAAWLLRHGRHMQSFGLFCHKGNSDAGLFAWELSACLGALATASSLQQLRVHFNCAGTALRITSWCAALRQLQQIDLTASSSFLRISSSLAGLVAVTRLELSGDAIIVGAEAQLPPNVEQLQLKDSESEALPQQLSGLTRLSWLMLSLGSCEPDGYAVLASLGRLARLVLEETSHLPACLSQLTALQELRLREASQAMQPADAAAALDGALPHLTQLTSLCMDDDLERCQPLPGLAGLARLQRCCLSSAWWAKNSEAPAMPLPLGPWAASLRSLGAPVDVLALSTEVLSAATQLTCLAVLGGKFQEDVPEAFWAGAHEHPSLRRLQIDVPAELKIPAATLQAICNLACEWPELKVKVVLDEEGTTFETDFFIDFEHV